MFKTNNILLIGLSESQLSSSTKILLATYFIAENGNNKESDDNKNSSEILEELPNTPPRKKMKTEEFVTPDEGNLLFIFFRIFLKKFWYSY